jgi:hypothetical protein
MIFKKKELGNTYSTQLIIFMQIQLLHLLEGIKVNLTIKKVALTQCNSPWASKHPSLGQISRKALLGLRIWKKKYIYTYIQSSAITKDITWQKKIYKLDQNKEPTRRPVQQCHSQGNYSEISPVGNSYPSTVGHPKFYSHSQQTF